MNKLGKCPKVIETITNNFERTIPMPEIIALFTVLYPYLSTTLIRQLSHIVFAKLAMMGRVTMLNISRWTTQGGSYRTIQRFFNTVLPCPTLFWVFFRTHLFDRDSDYILVADETVTLKSGKNTYGLSRFFSSIMELRHKKFPTH